MGGFVPIKLVSMSGAANSVNGNGNGAADRLAVWASSTTITSYSGLSWTGGVLTVPGPGYFVAPTATPFKIKALVGNAEGLLLYCNTATDVASVINYYNANLELGAANTAYQTISGAGKITLGATGSAAFHAVNGRGLDITYTTGGTTAYVQLVHSSNSANSGSALYLSVGGASGGNPFVHFNVLSVRDWTMGCNNGSSDAFQICGASSLGSSVYFQISTGGVVTIGTGTSTTHVLNTTVQTTVGAAGAASALPAQPTGYVLLNINGTNRALPYYDAA